MKKMNRILGGNIMWVCPLDGINGYIQNYFDYEKNEWASRHIDHLKQIFDIPYNEELILDLTNENIKELADGKLISFDTKLEIYKLSIYDRLFKVAEPLINKFIKDNNLNKDISSECDKEDTYFSILDGIYIDIERGSITFDPNTGHMYNDEFKFPLDCISGIIDIATLKTNIKDIFNVTLEKAYIQCAQYLDPENWHYDDTIYTISINDELYYTYTLFENSNFIK